MTPHGQKEQTNECSICKLERDISVVFFPVWCWCSRDKGFKRNERNVLFGLRTSRKGYSYKQLNLIFTLPLCCMLRVKLSSIPDSGVNPCQVQYLTNFHPGISILSPCYFHLLCVTRESFQLLIPVILGKIIISLASCKERRWEEMRSRKSVTKNIGTYYTLLYIHYSLY